MFKVIEVMLGGEQGLPADVVKTINQFPINPSQGCPTLHHYICTFITDFLGFASGLTLGWKMAARSFTDGSLGMELE